MSQLTQRIQALARTNTLAKKPPPPTKLQLQHIVQHEPESLQAKLATSPYAAILASPLRYCTFHRKHYPSRLLQRFEIGLHPDTHAAWGVPSDNGDGHGYYVKLHQSVLACVQKQEYKRLFRGAARYPKDMNQYLEQWMMQSLVAQVTSVTYEPVVDNGVYQCVLQLVQPTTTTTTTTTDVIEYPLYTSSWQPLYEAMVAQLDHPVPEKLGVLKSMDSVAFAVDLFRYHQWLRSASPSSKS